MAGEKVEEAGGRGKQGARPDQGSLVGLDKALGQD